MMEKSLESCGLNVLPAVHFKPDVADKRDMSEKSDTVRTVKTTC